MNLTSTKTWGEKIRNTDLALMWSTANIGTMGASDLNTSAFLAIFSSSAATNPGAPGRLWFDLNEQLMKLFVDVVDGTGCSVWIAIGPDRADDIFYAAESIPPRALLQPCRSQGQRAVERHGLELYPPRCFALSTLDTTAASGTWFAGCVQGITKAWASLRPTASTYSGLTQAGFAANGWCTPSDSVRGAMGRGGSGLGVSTRGVFWCWQLQGAYPSAGDPNIYPWVVMQGPRRSDG